MDKWIRMDGWIVMNQGGYDRLGWIAMVEFKDSQIDEWIYFKEPP